MFSLLWSMTTRRAAARTPSTWARRAVRPFAPKGHLPEAACVSCGERNPNTATAAPIAATAEAFVSARTTSYPLCQSSDRNPVTPEFHWHQASARDGSNSELPAASLERRRSVGREPHLRRGRLPSGNEEPGGRSGRAHSPCDRLVDSLWR